MLLGGFSSTRETVPHANLSRWSSGRGIGRATRPEGSVQQLEARRRQAARSLEQGRSLWAVARALNASQSPVWRRIRGYKADGSDGLRSPARRAGGPRSPPGEVGASESPAEGHAGCCPQRSITVPKLSAQPRGQRTGKPKSLAESGSDSWAFQGSRGSLFASYVQLNMISRPVPSGQKPYMVSRASASEGALYGL